MWIVGHCLLECLDSRECAKIHIFFISIVLKEIIQSILQDSLGYFVFNYEISNYLIIIEIE